MVKDTLRRYGKVLLPPPIKGKRQREKSLFDTMLLSWIRRQTHCCCGLLKIQDGALCIGILHHVFSLLLFIYALILIHYDFTEICKTLLDSYYYFNRDYFHQVDCVKAVYYTLCIYCVILFLDYSTSLLLIIGLKINKPAFLLPFLIFNGTSICLLTFFFLSSSIFYFWVHLYVDGLIFIVVFLFSISVTIYFWAVVYSAYLQLVEKLNISTIFPTDYNNSSSGTTVVEEREFDYYSGGGVP